MPDQIRVNGNVLSWGSITLKLGEERFTGFTAISYGDGRERVKVYGMGRSHRPRGRTRGKYTTEPVVVTGYKTSLQAFRQALADRAGGNSYGDVEFQIVVEYTEADETPITVEIEDCTWTKNTSSESESADPLLEDAEFDCILIRRNGLVLFDNAEEPG